MGTTHQADRSAWSSRPAFRPRQMLTAEQLNAGLADEVMREQLLNRAVHGYGVVVGLGVVVDENDGAVVERGCLELTGGLAFDRHGRMLHWRGGHIALSDVVGEPPDAPGRYTLTAHYAARPPSIDECAPFAGEQAHWWTEGLVFTLRPGCHSWDRSCAQHPEGACIGHDRYLCRRTGARPGPDPSNVPVSPDVEWLLAERGALCSTGSDDWWYDPDSAVGVPIACVEICDEAEPGCEPCYAFGAAAPDVCGVRPLVYRNPLLYELVRGCDILLPRVRDISWQDWINRGWRHEIPWEDFADRIARGLVIRFTRPIQRATLHSASIFVTALTQEEDADYWVGRRVPMQIGLLDESDDCVQGVQLVPDSDWLAAEVTGRRSSLFDRARFEVTIRGQLLRDACSRMLDARPLGIPDHERGHERPGGDFVSVFRVAPNPDKPYGRSQNSAD